MKRALLTIFLALIFQSPASAGDLYEHPPAMTSPKGTYRIERVENDKERAILVRMTPQRKIIEGFDSIHDWGDRYPNYRFVWAEDESAVAVIRFTHKFSEVSLFTLHDERAKEIALPDLDAIADAREKALIKKQPIENWRADTRFIDECTVTSSTLTLKIGSVYQGAWKNDSATTDFIERFVLRVRQGKAKIVKSSIE